MEKKRSFFRGYLHGSKSTSKLPCHLEGRSDSTTDTNTILEKALEKANMAVSYDSMERPVDAVRAYKEAVDLLQGVLETASPDDQSRLQKIVRKPFFLRSAALLRVRSGRWVNIIAFKGEKRSTVKGGG